MLPSAHLIDAVGTSYLDLLAAAAGCTIARPSRDYGVDGTLQEVAAERSGGYIPGTTALQFQLKTTAGWRAAEEAVSVDVPVRAYNAVRRRSGLVTPLYLFVICLHGENQDWLSFSHDTLSVRATAYWWREHGPPSSNARTVRLAIPQRNVLTSASLHDMLVDEGRRMVP